MSLSTQVKTALDETRLLMLGAQVLFGFKLNGVFQEEFVNLSVTSRYVDCAGQVLMATAIGLLVAPSMQHRIVENGEDTVRIHRITGVFVGMALLPFAVSLGLGFYIVFDHAFGMTAAFVAGSAFCMLAGMFWYGLGFSLRRKSRKRAMQEEKPTPLTTKIDQMLTEARVILPGAQALLGFQLTVTLTNAFGQLPDSLKLFHVASLCCVAVAIILLMTPAALHRISFAGEDTPSFFTIGSWFVILAPAPLAFGIAGDLYVATSTAAASLTLGAILALAVLSLLTCLWYIGPMVLRARAEVGDNQAHAALRLLRTRIGSIHRVRHRILQTSRTASPRLEISDAAAASGNCDPDDEGESASDFGACRHGCAGCKVFDRELGPELVNRHIDQTGGDQNGLQLEHRIEREVACLG